MNKILVLGVLDSGEKDVVEALFHLNSRSVELQDVESGKLLLLDTKYYKADVEVVVTQISEPGNGSDHHLLVDMQALVVVFDANSQSSFNAVKRLSHLIQQASERVETMILVGNFSDLNSP